MTSRHLYFGLLASLGLVIVGLVGGTVAAASLLSTESKALVATRTDSQSLEMQQQQLDRTKADIGKYRPLASIARGIVPQDKDQAQTVRDIVRIADQNGLKLGSITFPTSTLGTTGVAGRGQSQLKPVPGLSGVYSMPITLQSDAAAAAPYDRFINFLAGLERNRRTALISAVTVQPNPQSPGSVSFTLVIDEYIKP